MPLTDLLRPRRAFPLPPFDLAPLEFVEEDVLVLDEVVASIGPVPEPVESDPAPTAGELHSKIETHLRIVAESREAPEPVANDAAEELRNALAQLRRSVA